METVIVGLIGAAAAGYLIWRGYKSIGESSACASGSCAGCGGGCGCGSAATGHTDKRK
ncbi:MAG: FeoB-associated Cys-rich membrane protein [Veillonellaceae bacterium]|nr:FeoB-associated Cys-rich membrane protein [Veillonellaceae bacterium]